MKSSRFFRSGIAGTKHFFARNFADLYQLGSQLLVRESKECIALSKGTNKQPIKQNSIEVSWLSYHRCNRIIDCIVMKRLNGTHLIQIGASWWKSKRHFTRRMKKISNKSTEINWGLKKLNESIQDEHISDVDDTLSTEMTELNSTAILEMCVRGRWKWNKNQKKTF